MKGKVVKDVRYLDDVEMSREGWMRKTVAVEFMDGTILFASSDDEGNESGALFARKADGSPVHVKPMKG
jgi:hypothetical protein